MEDIDSGPYNAVEFVAFIVPRTIQFVLDVANRLNWVDNALAMHLYLGLSYALALVLFAMAVRLVARNVHDGALVIGRQTTWGLIGASSLMLLALFTALAPTTGLSLRYCAKTLAGFVSFER